MVSKENWGFIIQHGALIECWTEITVVGLSSTVDVRTVLRVLEKPPSKTQMTTGTSGY